ncbi:MAG: carboxylate-amine ligase [Sphingomonadales bacterium]
MTGSSRPSFTVGIEEEYLLVDRETRDLAISPPEELMADCERLLENQVTAEFLRSQIEVGTRVCKGVKEARGDLVHLRSTVAEQAAKYNLAPIAASTHPFGHWMDQLHTPKLRYDALLRDMAGAVRRLLICGMHVHVGIDDDDLRIDLMNQVAYFLPHLLALSTSSPFWQGKDMGMMSYRLLVFDGLPRTGLPDRFTSYAEYQRLVAQMVGAGLLEDASKIWWDIRPSARFPTLEMRTTDVCTRLDDCISIAALYQCLLSTLYRLRKNNQRWRIYPRTLIMENRWLAQRYGSDGQLVDFGKGRREPFGDLLEEIIAMLREDAEELDCVAEVQHAREILRRGTSAHRQLHVYTAAKATGADEREALQAVVDTLIADTLCDVA